MLRLTSAAFRRHQEIVREVYTVGSMYDFPARVARLLPRLISAESQGSAEMDYATQRFKATREPALDDLEQARLNSIFLAHVEQHPLATRPQEVVQGTALILSQAVGRRAFVNSGLYHEFYRAVGSRDELAMSVPSGGSGALCFFLWRDGPSFRPRELEQLAHLRPHVEQAYRNHRAFAEACGGGQSLVEDLATALARGLVLLDADGAVREWSACGRRLAHAYFPDWPAGRRQLPDPLRRWVRQLLDAEATSPGHEGARKPYHAEGPAGRLTIRLANRQSPGEYLLLFDEQREMLPHEPLLQLGLTPRECVIASWLAKGKTNPEIATILSANPLTIKVHLMHIFAKLGVETRTAAALRIAECVREAGEAA